KPPLGEVEDLVVVLPDIADARAFESVARGPPDGVSRSRLEGFAGLLGHHWSRSPSRSPPLAVRTSLAPDRWGGRWKPIRALNRNCLARRCVSGRHRHCPGSGGGDRPVGFRNERPPRRAPTRPAPHATARVPSTDPRP